MNSVPPDLLTTSQAALLLQVHESSVKRWSNQGELPSQKTSGGHRRIPLATLFDFARQKKIAADLLSLAPHEEEIALAGLAAREQNRFEALREVLLKYCDVQPSRDLTRLMAFVEEVMEIPLARLFDDAIGGALSEVGRQWQTGSRTIALEHRFTQKMIDGLHARFAAFEQKVPPHFSDRERPSLKAIVGCAEGCYHEIGGLMSRMILRRMGYEVTYLGANVPFEEVAGIQDLEQAHLVCLSFIPPLNSSDLRRALKVMGALYNPLRPYALVLGGAATEFGWQEPMPGPFLTIKSVTSMGGFELWLQTQALTLFSGTSSITTK